MSIYDFILLNQSPNKAAFDSKVIKTNKEVYGIKAEDLKNFAKHIVNNNLKENFVLHKIYEVDLVYGLTIAYKKQDIKEKILELKTYFKDVDNWAEVDIVTNVLKLKTDQFLDLLPLIKELISDNCEFVARFGYVLILYYFIEFEHLNTIFELINLSSHQFYVKMAIAWLISKCAMKDFARTLNYLINNHLPFDLARMIKVKIKDSRNISQENKSIIEKWYQNQKIDQ